MIANVLFVCLGNICRSPLAEAAMRRAVMEWGVAVGVDSAGTGDWHVGRPPDRRAQQVALRHGVDISAYRARQSVADPYYGEAAGFDTTWADVTAGAEALLAAILRR